MAREQRAVRLAVAETESSWEMRHGDSTGVHVVAGLIGERLTRRLLHDPALPLPKDMTVIDAAYLSAKVCGVWCVVCGVWCVVCGVWLVGRSATSLASPSRKACGLCRHHSIIAAASLDAWRC
jgi:hypothetical protein